MTTVVALVLSTMFYSTKDMVARNVEVDKKRSIFAAAGDYLPTPLSEMADAEVLDLFDKQVEQVVIDMEGDELDGIMAENVDMNQEGKKPEAERYLPVFIYKTDKEKLYIVSVRGKGLWDAIWGNVAIKSDFNTVAGIAFDHAGETPGLGAEIKDNKAFPRQFKGKKIYDGSEYKSVFVRKGGAKNDTYEVDGISGATVTSDGVTEMLFRGLKYYEPYFSKVKSS